MTFRTSSLFTALSVLIILSLLPMASIAGGRKPGPPKLKTLPHGAQLNLLPEAPPKHIRMAHNFFVLYDPSTAMTAPYKDSGLTRLEMSKRILLKSNASLPELKWQTGLYPHWKNVMWLPGSPGSFHPYYALQNYNKAKFTDALSKLPVISSGPPMLQMSLMKLEYLLGLPGRTEVFLFSNGEDARFKGVDEPAPVAQAKMLAEKYDVCFTIINSATTKEAEKVLYDIAGVNDCSQVVDFDTVAAHPEHLFGKLYMTPDGIFKNVLFAFDKSGIRKKYRNTLDKLGNYLIDNPEHYAVLSGFCDIIGSEKYNIRLSQRRAESAQKYLLDHFPINKDRVLLYWYGYANPVASNKTVAGRRLNRRVSIMIRKGLDGTGYIPQRSSIRPDTEAGDYILPPLPKKRTDKPPQDSESTKVSEQEEPPKISVAETQPATSHEQTQTRPQTKSSCGKPWKTPLIGVMGKINKIEYRTPPGTDQEGLHLDVETSSGKNNIVIHVFPKNLISQCGNLFNFEKGEMISVSGSEFFTGKGGGQRNICAATITQNSGTLKLRDPATSTLDKQLCCKEICRRNCAGRPARCKGNCMLRCQNK